MVQCEACEKWLHAECDNVTEDTYRKISAKKISYYCPQCKENGEDHAVSCSIQTSPFLAIFYLFASQ